MRLAEYDPHCVAGDEQLLICGDGIGEQFGIISGDESFACDRLLVFHGVDLKTGPLHAFANPGANLRRVLSNAAGEDNRVRTAHAGEEGTDIFAGTVTENFY